MANINANEVTYPTVQFARLSRDQALKIHWASLDILERLGVQLHLQEATDLLHRGGADVAGNIVRIPAWMVEKAFSTVPHRVVLYDRRGRPAIPLEGDRCFYGPGSDCMNIVDHRTGERRKPVLQDVVEGSVLCDALPGIDFLMSMILPADLDQSRADLFQMEAMLSNSVKPILNVSYELQGLVGAVEMAEAVMGGADALRRTPLLSCYINVLSGINHNKEALQKLIYLAGKGLPAIYVPAATGGVTSPITAAGAVAVDNAGVLLGLVLSQLTREGAPYIMTGMLPVPMDMRTMVIPYNSPERGIFQALADLYRLPCFGWGGVTDSKTVDGQAAAEAALTLLAESLCGGNLIHDLGYLESGLTFSFAQLVICEEMIGWIQAFMRGVDVTDETLALDVVAETGPSGHFLNKEHTRRHFRELWTPRLFDRTDHKTWAAQGSKTLGERAAARVEQILREHRPEPLAAGVQARLRQILER